MNKAKIVSEINGWLIYQTGDTFFVVKDDIAQYKTTTKALAEAWASTH